jgi:hypothetical protein
MDGTDPAVSFSLPQSSMSTYFAELLPLGFICLAIAFGMCNRRANPTIKITADTAWEDV